MEQRLFESNEKRQEFFDIFDRYNKDPHYLLPILNEIQERFGYLRPEMLQTVSQHLGIPLGKVYSVVTFSKHFKLEPQGRYVIEVCSGASCKVKGGSDILSVLEAELAVKAGQTTPNRLFTIIQTSCIDACALAPAMRVNGHLYGRLEAKDVLRIIKEYEVRL